MRTLKVTTNQNHQQKMNEMRAVRDASTVKKTTKKKKMKVIHQKIKRKTEAV